MLFKRFIKITKKEDTELIELYLELGELKYLGELYQRYTHLVFGVCMKYLKNEEDSKDAVMQIFEKLIETVKKHEIANFKSWLYVLTKNHCLMWLRKQKNKSHYEKNADNIMESSYEMHLFSEEEKDIQLNELEKALGQLPNKQKECVELFYLKDKNYKQIAVITGYEIKEVKSYIQNGKRNLRSLMKDSNE